MKRWQIQIQKHKMKCQSSRAINQIYSRVQSGSGILDLLNQAGHVLEEDVVKLLLLHVLQLERRSVLGASHDAVVESEGD